MWAKKYTDTTRAYAFFAGVCVCMFGGRMGWWIVTVAYRGGNLPAGRTGGDKGRRIGGTIRTGIADQDHRERDAGTHVLRPLEGYRRKAQQVTK